MRHFVHYSNIEQLTVCKLGEDLKPEREVEKLSISGISSDLKEILQKNPLIW